MFDFFFALGNILIKHPFLQLIFIFIKVIHSFKWQKELKGLKIYIYIYVRQRQHSMFFFLVCMCIILNNSHIISWVETLSQFLITQFLCLYCYKHKIFIKVKLVHCHDEWVWLILAFFFFYFLRSNHRFYPILEDPSRYSIPQAHATSPVSSRCTAQPPSWALLLSPSSLQWVLCLLNPTATYVSSFPVSFLWGTTFRASKESVHR